MTARHVPHVVILGGGFGGLAAARLLRRGAVRITLIDRRNHHLFQPLLYQVASAALNPSDIAYPIRAILRGQQNVTVLLADATRIDAAAKRVHLAYEDGTEVDIDYDFLVVATGATHSYFGNDHWAPHAPGLKTIEDAEDIRHRVLYAYEAAERETDAAARQQWLNFVVVGAGPTGVEMAGAFAEIARYALVDDFYHIDPKKAGVILVEGLDRVLPPYPEKLSASALRQLEQLGVEVRTGARVTAIDAEGVSLGGDFIPTRTVVWAAGVAGSPIGRSLGVPLDRAGRVVVEPDLSVPGRPEVFVVGDLAAAKQEDGGTVPGVAPAAMQGGRHAARAILARLAGVEPKPFRYVNKGSLAIIGRARAVADLPGGIRLSGLVAWLAWLFVHILFLVDFRNRIAVMMEWGWYYVSHHRGARLITGPSPPVTRRNEGV